MCQVKSLESFKGGYHPIIPHHNHFNSMLARKVNHHKAKRTGEKRTTTGAATPKPSGREPPTLFFPNAVETDSTWAQIHRNKYLQSKTLSQVTVRPTDSPF